jgi:hypothetical protein
MTEPRHLDLVDRLRGQYHLPVNDGAGPLNGSMTFSREFPTPPIQKEAAAVIEGLREVLQNLMDCSRAIVGADLADERSAEAFDMFYKAHGAARTALRAVPPQGDAVTQDKQAT